MPGYLPCSFFCVFVDRDQAHVLIIGHYEKSKYKQRLYKIFHSIVCIFITSTTLTVHIIWRVHNRFGGMRDLAYFQGGIRDES